MPTIYKKYPAGSIRNNRQRAVTGKRFVRTDIVSGTLRHYPTDHFKLKNVLGDIGKTIVNTALIIPKAVATAVAPKKLDQKIEDWGYQGTDFSNDVYGAKLERGNDMTNKILSTGLQVAAGVVAADKIIDGVKTIKANRDLNADIASASAPIQNPPDVSGITGSLSPTEVIQSPIVPTPKTTVVDEVKKVASKITPANINKATQLVNAGTGLLTKDQKTLQRNLTNPAMLPKTKASKDAERALTLPYVSSNDKPGVAAASIPFDSKTAIIAGVVLAVIVILAIVLKK